MFGLPTETTLIMGGVILFWVAYTLIFFVTTKSWSVEDSDYDHVPAESAVSNGGEPSTRADGRNPEGGEFR